MVCRTVQDRGNGSFAVVIPGVMIESVGLQPGQKAVVKLESGKIVIEKLVGCMVGISIGMSYSVAGYALLLAMQTLF